MKKQIYNFFVRRNGRIWYEYERYVREHIDEHRKHRIKHLIILARLNWFYCVKKGNTPFLYWDVPLDPNSGKKDATKMLKNNERKNDKKTYIPESSKINQNAPHWVAMECMGYDVVSFDIYDTLVFRAIDDPKALFMLVGERLGILGFYNIRINAEKEARDNHNVIYGNRETTLQEIYEIIERKTGINSAYGIGVEEKCELELSHANPYMARLFDLLKYQGKRIIIVTDMYMPRQFLEKLLRKNGFDGYSQIYVSNEYQLSKSDGSLWDLVINKEKIEPSHIIHIGDNRNGDIKQAEKHGIKTKYYVNVNEYGKQSKPSDMSRLIGAAYGGIVNERFYSGLKKYSFAYEYGFACGGLYVLGYMHYVYQKCEDRGYDKILFLARDGAIYKKVFDKYFKGKLGVETEYLLWSRIPSEFVNISSNRESFINTFINDKCKGKIPTTIEDLMKSLDLELLIPLMEQRGISKEENICENNRKIMTTFFADHWNDVTQILEKKDQSIRAYLRKVVGKSKNVAIVDVGWTGKNCRRLKNALITDNESLQVDIFLAGYTALANEYEELQNNIYPYIFSCQKNRNLFMLHHKDKKPINNLFEILTQDTRPSFSMALENDLAFDLPEVENYKIISEIHQGIEDFAEIWMKQFKKYPFMINISGQNAYMPFAWKCRDLEWFRYVFDKFSVSMKTMSTRGKNKLETISDIL